MKKNIIFCLLLILFIIPINANAANYYTSSYSSGGNSFKNKTITSVKVGSPVSASKSQSSYGSGMKSTVTFIYSANSSCGNTSYTITFSDGTKETGTVYYKTDWKNKQTGSFNVLSGYSHLNNNSANVAYNNCQNTNKKDATTGLYIWNCKERYTRCGGGGGSTIVTPTPNNNDVNVCEQKDVANEKTKKLSEKYYTIDTYSEDKVSFDMNKDGKEEDTLKLKSGESFTFEVKVETKKELTGTFKASEWKSKYTSLENEYISLENFLKPDNGVARENTARHTLATVSPTITVTTTYDCEVDGKKTTCSKEAQEPNPVYVEAQEIISEIEKARRRKPECYNELLELESIVKYYNDNYVNITNKNFFTPVPEVKLNFKYKSDGKELEQTASFSINESKSNMYPTIEKADKKQVLYIAETKITKNKVETFNFIYNNKNNPSKLYYLPQEQTLNKRTGELGSDYPVNGYNRIYTDKQKVDAGVYDVSIKVEHLGVEGNEYELPNNNCKLSYQESELLFRVIEVSNPFISSTYVPGINWKDGRYGYNFTGIIDNLVWSKKVSSEVILDSSMIKVIQKDNSIEKYLGTCDLKTSNNQICDLIK